jgi:hypothetical protein
MGNARKRQGDKAELAAILYLAGLAPEHTVERPRRVLGAGRRDDEGDILVFPGVAIQVKAWRQLSDAIREAATGAAQQAVNAEQHYHLGLSKRHAARTDSWVASAASWPVSLDLAGIPVIGQTARAVSIVTSSVEPTTDRIVLVRRQGVPDLYVAHPDAWITAWRTAVSAPARSMGMSQLEAS